MCYCRCLDIAPRAQLLKTSAWLLHPIGDKALLAGRDSNDVVIVTPETVGSVGV